MSLSLSFSFLGWETPDFLPFLIVIKNKNHTVFSYHLLYGTFLQCLAGCQGTFILFILFLMNDSVFIFMSHKVCK